MDTTDGDSESAKVTPEEEPLASVEEYLAARKQENQLFSFQRYVKTRKSSLPFFSGCGSHVCSSLVCRYKKGSEWRTPLTSSSANTQTQQAGKRKFVMSIQRQKEKATAASDAQFLDLLQWRGTGNGKSNQKCTKLRHPWRTPRQGHDTVPMTVADGTRVYLKCTSVTNHHTTASTTKPTCALGVTIKELVRRVENIKRRQIHIANQLKRMGENETDTNFGGLVDSTLWVDKHAPSSFPQLLSDERTNREVLRALRAWDPYVFGKQPMPERKTMYHGNNDSNPTTSNQDTDKNPNDKRPAENARVIMLSGPPGVGAFDCCVSWKMKLCE
jgi:hypothetical protein